MRGSPWPARPSPSTCWHFAVLEVMHLQHLSASVTGVIADVRPTFQPESLSLFVGMPAPRGFALTPGASRKKDIRGGRDHTRRACIRPGGLPISVSPRWRNTYGAQRKDRHIQLRRPPFYTQLCPCGRHTYSGIIVLTLGTRPLPQRVLSATITSSPRVRILVRLLRFRRLGNSDGATLSTSYLNASVSLAWTAMLHLPFSGMTSCGCALGRTTQRRCCWRQFRPVLSPLLLLRLVLSRSFSILQLPWAVFPLGT